jgi:hypothetical protein
MGRNHTQRARFLQLLLEARGAEVGLPEILDLTISQFGARLKELRSLGFHIENRQETRDGQRLSFYRLRLDSAPTSPAQNLPEPKSESGAPATLFEILPPERSYRE